MFLTSSGGSRKSQISMVAPQLISTMYFTFLWFLKQESALQKVRKSPRMNIYKEQRKVHFKIYRVPPPNLPMCQNPEKNRVPNWPPQKMAESRTCHPQKMAESPTLVSLGVASPGLWHFLAVASLGLCFFLDLWKIWGWQEGSDTLYH